MEGVELGEKMLMLEDGPAVDDGGWLVDSKIHGGQAVVEEDNLSASVDERHILKHS